MGRFLVAAMALVLSAGGISATAPTASATTTWVVTSGQFTVDDGFGDILSITVQNLRITDRATATGYVLAADSRYTCSTQTFTGPSAAFFVSRYEPCDGTITFTVDPTTGVVSASAALGVASRLFSGTAIGTAQGAPLKPVVAPLQGCTATADSAAGEIDLSWTDDPAATEYTVTVNGLVGASETLPAGSAASVPFSLLTPGASYSATVTATDAAGDVVATCTTNDAVVPWPIPGTPVVVGAPVPVVGGQVTVNYGVSDPATVQGIEYRIDGGPWLRPGGTAPIAGVGGAFTVDSLSVGRHTMRLRSVGFDPAPLTTEGASLDFVIPAPATQPGAGSRPSQGSPNASIGSTPSAPVAPPPTQPTSSVPGTSNGAGSGTNGALAAGTGDAGIDAPCLAQDGTLYPTLYSTVGSQVTMAPNTRGMGRATSFTVVGGALPAGMQLDRRFGIVYGVTTQAGSWTTTVRARFADGRTRDAQFGTRVDRDSQTLQYAAQNIGSVGLGLSIAPTTNAPAIGTTYRLVCGTLPPGTRLDTSTGRIVGTPTAVVGRPIPLRVSETSSAGTAAASFIVVVDRAGARRLSYPSHPHARVGTRITIRPTVSGVGDIAEFRTWKGKLPAGLRLNHRTGVISGRIAHPGRTHTISLVAETKAGALLTAAPMRLSLRR